MVKDVACAWIVSVLAQKIAIAQHWAGGDDVGMLVFAVCVFWIDFNWE